MTGGGYSDLDTQSLAAEKARGQEEDAAGHTVSVFRKQKSGREMGYAIKPQGPPLHDPLSTASVHLLRA